ncbi:hypothetical protein NE850_25950 [Paraburkholderia sp. USG1]|jgi:hypothetical protein|uniref:hypothetical protein n=1 Tax=Paraburkholderia sp. USG1 TaxID=2952268 RepID=UPI00285DE60D|nr:hypothetical protein [Paraburkholderia sp. USG1]MDR8399755.1 hypothetical protein [Paraburkholderia sp. USG1]
MATGDSQKIKAKEFVEQVEELEGVVIALWTDASTQVKPYSYARMAAGNMSIADWIEGRIKPKIGDIAVRVIDGGYSTPHRGQLMSTLRKSYQSE